MLVPQYPKALKSPLKRGSSKCDHVVIGFEPPQCRTDLSGVWGEVESHEWLARRAIRRATDPPQAEVETRTSRDFESSYGANGEWVNLFNRHPAFIRTELLKDQKDPMRFLTIDTWKSREQYMSFRKEFQKEYDAIDNKCEAFTLNEQSLGEFDLQQ